ncbi:Xaa-Pro aminopeptidase [Halomicronema hongdechloris C2206]|uniref:Xaa-Pro aminopeptidase n=1 Tax=Halomicronema hongdechloris C2206 TaxID=1641165 RepID=A0A1Z3HMH8_9CYAN|nr:aminopeptidase P N-terminal domain-containing protein [Halomicronema hongdechloris]ASC71521.1 Xaa-Pro aminopeptidase [Halomicronema hongdechloris C2206]
MQSIFQARREVLMARIGQGAAVFGAAPMVTMHSDVEHPFRQDSDFYYLTGFNEPQAVAVLAPHHEEHRFVLFVRPKDKEQEIWSGYRVGVEGTKERYGADEVYPIQELDQHLPKYLEKAERLYYHLGCDRTLDDKILHHWQQLLVAYRKRGTGPVAIEDAQLVLQQQRRVKQPEEIELLRQAIAISAKAHNHAREITQPGRYEYEIQAEIEHLFRLQGAMGPAYPSIVASGSNACILHYIDNNRQMQAGDLLLIDAGCAYQYYNADITRTFPVGGHFSPEQRILYELVLEAQRQAIDAVRPGQPFNAFHDAATRVITEALVDLGLLQGEIDTLIEEKTHKAFFMHGTGHFLGLDVHDVGTLRNPDKSWQPFQPGNVVTVEPGIYIAPDYEPAEGQPVVDERWRGIGIRIEDDVLVTAAGHEVLTAAVPKSLEAMES